MRGGSGSRSSRAAVQEHDQSLRLLITVGVRTCSFPSSFSRRRAKARSSSPSSRDSNGRASPATAVAEPHAINRRIFPVWRASYQDDKATWGMIDLPSHVIGDVRADGASQEIVELCQLMPEAAPGEPALPAH
jgi:hypothetical protein